VGGMSVDFFEQLAMVNTKAKPSSKF